MSLTIKLKPDVNGFAENKDTAKSIREKELLPALDRHETVVLDFSEVNYATQSYIHALIGEALNKHKEEAIHLLEFKNCSLQLRGIIQLVVDYSMGGFPSHTDYPHKVA